MQRQEEEKTPQQGAIVAAPGIGDGEAFAQGLAGDEGKQDDDGGVPGLEGGGQDECHDPPGVDARVEIGDHGVCPPAWPASQDEANEAGEEQDGGNAGKDDKIRAVHGGQSLDAGHRRRVCGRPRWRAKSDAQRHAQGAGRESVELRFENIGDDFHLDEDLAGQPDRKPHPGGQRAAQVVGAFPEDAGDERDEGAGERDAVGALDHFVDGGVGFEQGVGGDEQGEYHHGDARSPQELAVGHFLEEAAQHVFGEGHRGGEQGSRGGAHDDREERAEKNHLGGKGHARHDEDGHDLLGVVQRNGFHHGRIDEQRRVGDENRHETEEDVEESAQGRSPHGDALAARGIDPLEDVLLRNRAERQSEKARGAGQEVARRHGGEIEFARVDGVIHHRVDPARHVLGDPGNVEQPQHDHDHLHEGRHRHRPHSAEQGVDQHHRRADDHARVAVDGAAREKVEHQPERGDLRAHPAEVGDDDADREREFDATGITAAEEVAQGEKIHAVKRPGEKQPEQHQAHARAQRVGNQPARAVLEKGARIAKHGLRAKPGGEHHGEHHGHGQMPPGSDVVAGVMHLRRGEESDTDGDDEISDDEPKQHDGHSGKTSIEKKRRKFINK